jgi:tetratricopeptide (TPR) repeat protein
MYKKVILIIFLLIPIITQAQTRKAKRAFAKGQIAAEKYQYVGASVHFTQAISLDSAYTKAYFQRGLSFINMGQVDAGIKDLQKTIDQDPNNINYHITLIAILKKMQKYHLALDATDQMERHHTQDNMGAIYYERGDCYHFLQDTANAKSNYTKALELFSKEGPDFNEIRNYCKERLEAYK